MQEKINILTLREHLNDYCEHIQKFSNKSSSSNESKTLVDDLAQQYCYMFNDIIDYLEQNQ